MKKFAVIALILAFVLSACSMTVSFGAPDSTPVPAVALAAPTATLAPTATPQTVEDILAAHGFVEDDSEASYCNTPCTAYSNQIADAFEASYFIVYKNGNFAYNFKIIAGQDVQDNMDMVQLLVPIFGVPVVTNIGKEITYMAQNDLSNYSNSLDGTGWTITTSPLSDTDTVVVIDFTVTTSGTGG